MCSVTQMGSHAKPPPSGAVDGAFVVRKWSTSTVGTWLGQLGDAYVQYVDEFAKSSIDGDLLVTMDADDLQELGVTKRVHRRLIMREIEHLKLGAPSQDVASAVQPSHAAVSDAPAAHAAAEAVRLSSAGVSSTVGANGAEAFGRWATSQEPSHAAAGPRVSNVPARVGKMPGTGGLSVMDDADR